jgi:hypothetical protein
VITIAAVWNSWLIGQNKQPIENESVWSMFLIKFYVLSKYSKCERFEHDVCE